jgi:2-octaprenyl-6-methoxyphenol hydroxylase
MRETTDILIAGGGVAGLTAAAAFASAGFRVICVDPDAPVTDAGDDRADLRSTAFLQPARTLLDHAGLWTRLATHATPLQVMRIIDAGGPHPDIRRSAEFDAAEISDLPFGWNIPNWLIRRELADTVGTMPGVSFRPGVSLTGLLPRDREAIATLSDGTRIAARMVVAADGRDSPTRDALGIGTRTLRYGQKALAFAVTHPIPHGNVSTEIHRWGGPFTLVPLPDRDGLPASAVVWMERGPEAERLATLPVAAFEQAMTDRSAHILGPLTLVTRRSVWPIISRLAHRFAGQRTALIAEAAHVMPPIGAQGLNTSLADIACLLDLAVADPATLGATVMLDRYDRMRRPEVTARVMGIDALNRAAMAGSAPLRDLRGAVLGLLHGAPPVRKALMRAGLGQR